MPAMSLRKDLHFRLYDEFVALIVVHAEKFGVVKGLAQVEFDQSLILCEIVVLCAGE
jgi:endonuclease III-like uncharacterized protein